MQAIMTATPRAPRMMAKGLARPSRRVSSAGRPNTPLPMMVLMTRAVIVQRPIDRISGIGVWGGGPEVYRVTLLRERKKLESAGGGRKVSAFISCDTLARDGWRHRNRPPFVIPD